MAESMRCPGCGREVGVDGRARCLFCGYALRAASPLPAGPRLAPLMDALPAEDDRVSTRPLRCPEPSASPAARPKLHVEAIESREARARSKGGVALKIGLGLLCVLSGGVWIAGGLALGVFFKYPIVLVIAGFGLLIDGIRRKER